MIQSQNNQKFIEMMKNQENILEDKEIGNHLSDFEILQVLGEGGFGFVAKVKSKKNLQIYAMKKYDLSQIKDPDLLKYYENESIFMKNLNHPNICKLYSSFREENSIYMIMEFMDNGDLFTFINANMKLQKMIKEEKLWNIFEQCLNGLVYIHSKGLIHRDIKPANLLLNNEGQVKLSDFNVSALESIEKAKFFTKDQKKEQELLNIGTQVGSGSFQAPEVRDCDDETLYDDKVDIYSMGITFCSLAFYKVELPSNAYNIYSKELVNIIRRMLDPNKYSRPNSLQLYNDFIKAYVEKYIHSTGLKSCINCLSLYSSLIYYFLNQGDNISPLNEISFHFNKIIQALNLKKTKKNLYNSIVNNPDNKSYNYLLYEFRDLLYKNGIKKFENGSNEIAPISIINLLLKKMHEELNTKRFMLGSGNNYYHKFVQRGNRKQDAYDNYMIFYNSNFESIISNNFFGLIKTKRICQECNSVDYLFNMFSYIPFNIKILVDKYPQKKNDLNLYDAFDCLNTNYVVLNERKCITCETCNIHTKHNEFKQFYNLPKNLIIFFDRGENNQYKDDINFDQKLNLTKYVECFIHCENNVVYDLLGVIIREIIPNDNDDKIGIREKYISFTLSKNSSLYINSENNKEYDLCKIKKIGKVIGLFYYCDYVEPNFISDDIISQFNLNNNNNNNNFMINKMFNNNQNNQNLNIIQNGNNVSPMNLSNNIINSNLTKNQGNFQNNNINNQNINNSPNNFNSNNGFNQNIMNNSNNIGSNQNIMNNSNNNGFNQNIIDNSNINGFNQNIINNSNNNGFNQNIIDNSNFSGFNQNIMNNNNNNGSNQNIMNNSNNSNNNWFNQNNNNFNNYNKSNNNGFNQNINTNSNKNEFKQNNINQINNNMFNSNNQNINNFKNNNNINKNSMNNNNFNNNMGFNQNNMNNNINFNNNNMMIYQNNMNYNQFSNINLINRYKNNNRNQNQFSNNMIENNNFQRNQSNQMFNNNNNGNNMNFN